MSEELVATLRPANQEATSRRRGASARSVKFGSSRACSSKIRPRRVVLTMMRTGPANTVILKRSEEEKEVVLMKVATRRGAQQLRGLVARQSDWREETVGGR